jgi:hypothetical protein
MMALLRPTPEEETYRALLEHGPTTHEGGFLSRVKDIGLGAVYGAATAPSGQAGMGLLGGALGSAVNPNIAHNLQYRAQVPYAGQRAQLSRGLADEELNRRMGYAHLYGVDPETGQPTMGMQTAENRQAMQEMAKQIQLLGLQQRGQNYTATQSYKERQLIRQQKRDAEKAFNDRVKLGGGSLTDEQVQDIADEYGINLPSGFNYRQHQLKLDSAGVYQAVDRATGLNPAGQSVTGFDKTKLASLDAFRQALVRTGAMNADTHRMNANANWARVNQQLDTEETRNFKSAAQFEDKAAGYDQQADYMEGNKQANGQPYPPAMVAGARARAQHLRERAQQLQSKPRTSGTGGQGNYPALRSDSGPGTYITRSGKVYIVTGNPTGNQPVGHPAPQ